MLKKSTLKKVKNSLTKKHSEPYYYAFIRVYLRSSVDKNSSPTRATLTHRQAWVQTT